MRARPGAICRDFEVLLRLRTTFDWPQIDLVILKRHDKLPAPLESACRWLSFFPLIKSSLK
jgi:hypothetical protein